MIVQTHDADGRPLKVPGIVPKLSDIAGAAAHAGAARLASTPRACWRRAVGAPAPRTTTGRSDAADSNAAARCAWRRKRWVPGRPPGRVSRSREGLRQRVGGVGHPQQHGARAHRPRHQVAPAAGGSPGAPRHRAAPGLDALGHHAQAEFARRPHGALDHRSRIVAARSAATVARSICNSRTGWCDSAASPASPAAKSSIDTLHAETARRSKARRVASVFSIAAACVSSHSRPSAGTLCAFRPRSRRWAKSSRRELHAGDVHRHAQPDARSATRRSGATRRRAPSRRWSPINPWRSATGMKRADSTSPSVGWRASAAAPRRR